MSETTQATAPRRFKTRNGSVLMENLNKEGSKHNGYRAWYVVVASKDQEYVGDGEDLCLELDFKGDNAPRGSMHGAGWDIVEEIATH